MQGWIFDPKIVHNERRDEFKIQKVTVLQFWYFGSKFIRRKLNALSRSFVSTDDFETFCGTICTF